MGLRTKVSYVHSRGKQGYIRNLVSYGVEHPQGLKEFVSHGVERPQGLKEFSSRDSPDRITTRLYVVGCRSGGSDIS